LSNLRLLDIYGSQRSQGSVIGGLISVIGSRPRHSAEQHLSEWHCILESVICFALQVLSFRFKMF